MIDVATTLDLTVCAEPGIGGPYDPHIRCPLCGWRPRVDSRWICPCDKVFNPFDTGGICPECLVRDWPIQCGECREFSPYADWYEPKG